MSEELIEKQRIKQVITPRELIYKYLHYLPWIFISVAITLVAAYIKLRYSTPIYEVSGKLLVSAPGPASGGSDKFDIFSMGGSDKINDQIEIIKSRAIATRVIRSLELQKQVYNRGKIRSTIIHPRDIPFNFTILAMDSLYGFSVTIKLQDNGQFLIDEQPEKYNFDQTVTLPQVSFRVSHNNRDFRAFASREFVVTWQSAENLSPGLSGSIAVARLNDFTNVLNLSYSTENTRMGVDIVNQYMLEYQKATLEDKREIAARTLNFIDEQLDTVRYDLGTVERNLQQYREKNRVFNPDAQSQLFLSDLSQSDKELLQEGTRLKVTDYLINYLSDQKNKNSIIPSMMGIGEPALLQQVTEFNKLQLERETMLSTTPSGNPRMLEIETAIEKLRTDMIENLRNVRQTNLLTLDQLNRKNLEANQQISSMPAKQKQLLEVTRQQTILQELYSFLLQKKLETAIASASTISNIKVVEPAMGSGVPVSPNKKALYIIAVFLGIGIPAAIIFLKEYLNDKIKDKHEIEQITTAPILGEIGHAEQAGALVVTKNNRKFLAEQFRIVRSNLQYILPKVEKPVLLVTSSFSGEGKSFISTNLGAVLALSGKRTVILEFDIRKPKILKGLGLQERKGITNYLVGNIDLNEVIHPVTEVDDLFVIPCGPVPPNPAEMLLNEKVSQIFVELRSRFDVIIVDTAPVGLVSDATTLGQHADATIYVVRHNYTLKKQVHLIDELYRHNKLPHLSIIVNDINARGGYGGYYGYGGYDYGYGYGMNGDSSGYFENEGSKKRKGLKTWLSRSGKK
jgi:tyrosine-protein kinase Etk/Wzc